MSFGTLVWIRIATGYKLIYAGIYDRWYRQHNMHNDTGKWAKPNTFHEAFCKIGIDPAGVNRLTIKSNQQYSITIAKMTPPTVDQRYISKQKNL